MVEARFYILHGSCFSDLMRKVEHFVVDEKILLKNKMIKSDGQFF